MTLDAELIIKLHVQCDKNMDVKDDGSGYLRVIPIIGGTFEGKINGAIVPGGADWNTEKKAAYSHAFAKYLLKTDDGEFIAIENEGKIGVNDKNFIKTSPKFQADSAGKYAWLNAGVYVASLDFGKKDWYVDISIYKLN